MPVISALGKARQEDLEFEASVNFIARLCLKKKKKTCKEGEYNGNILYTCM
jgi:hypothetical protein